MTTVVPATSTECPAVVTASTTASRGVFPARQRRAVAGEDQQRVVDADAEPEHARDRSRPVGHVHDRGEQPDQRRGDPEAEQRGDDRQPGGDERPERQDQHERGDQQADRLGGQLALLGGGDHLAAHLDAQPVSAARAVSAERDQALAGRVGDAVGLLGQRQPRDRDRPVARDLGRARPRRCPSSCVAAASSVSVRSSHALDARVRLPHDVDGVGRAAGEAIA